MSVLLLEMSWISGLSVHILKMTGEKIWFQLNKNLQFRKLSLNQSTFNWNMANHRLCQSWAAWPGPGSPVEAQSRFPPCRDLQLLDVTSHLGLCTCL